MLKANKLWEIPWRALLSVICKDLNSFLYPIFMCLRNENKELHKVHKNVSDPQKKNAWFGSKPVFSFFKLKL